MFRDPEKTRIHDPLQEKYMYKLTRINKIAYIKFGWVKKNVRIVPQNARPVVAKLNKKWKLCWSMAAARG